MNTGLEYNLALRVRSATRWVEGQQGMLPPEEQFVPPIGYGGDGSVKLTKIDITVGSQAYVAYSPPPFNQPFIAKIPAFGLISGTNTYVYISGDSERYLARKNNVVCFLHSLKTYTRNGVTYPYYQSFSHNEEIRHGSTTTTQDGTRIITSNDGNPAAGGNAIQLQGYEGFEKINFFGYCLFRQIGEGVVLMLSNLSTIFTSTAYYQEEKWIIWVAGYRYPLFIYDQGILLLGRVSKSSFVNVTVRVDSTDFSLSRIYLLSVCVPEYPSGGAHDPFQVAAPYTPSTTLGAPLGAPLGG